MKEKQTIRGFGRPNLDLWKLKIENWKLKIEIGCRIHLSNHYSLITNHSKNTGHLISSVRLVYFLYICKVEISALKIWKERFTKSCKNGRMRGMEKSQF